MRVLATREFQDCVDGVVRTTAQLNALNEFPDGLSRGWTQPEYRAARLTGVDLWATRPVRIAGENYRITWEIAEIDDEDVIVCWTLALA